MLMQHISCGFLEQACQLKTETITYEEKEQQLVNDCVKELSMSFYYFKILFEVVWFKKRKKKTKQLHQISQSFIPAALTVVI